MTGFSEGMTPVEKWAPLASYRVQVGQRSHSTKASLGIVGKEGMMMPYSLKEHVAECYRRADEYGRLHQRASNSKERETLWFTRQHFLLLAGVLERKLSKLQAAPRRSVGKLRSGGVRRHLSKAARPL